MYGVAWAEELFFDIAEAYETWDACQYVEDERPESLTIERWTVCPIDNAIPEATSIIERIVDDYCDDCGMEGAGEAMNEAGRDPDVVAAFTAARELLLSKFTWREADRLDGKHVITWDERGEPLVDGEPMYVPRCRGFAWMGQSLAHCENCGNDITLHDGLAWHNAGTPLFSGETEIIPFDEARERIPLFGAFVTPRITPKGPVVYRYEKGWDDDLPKIPISNDEGSK